MNFASDAIRESPSQMQIRILESSTLTGEKEQLFIRLYKWQ